MPLFLLIRLCAVASLFAFLVSFQGPAHAQSVVAPSCPQGYTLSGNQCVLSTPTPSCPQGYTYSQGQCIVSGAATPTPNTTARPLPTPYQPTAPVLPAPTANYALELQTELKRLGCLRGRVDGIWGGGSRAALRRFANQAGLRLGSEPSQQAIDEARRTESGFCQPVQVAPQPPVYQPPAQQQPAPPTVVKKKRCSAIKFAFTRGNTCACAGGRIFTGSACIKPDERPWRPGECRKIGNATVCS